MPDERRREHLSYRPTGKAKALQQHCIVPECLKVGEAVHSHQRLHHEGEEDPVAGIHAKAPFPWSDLEERMPVVDLLLDETDAGHDSRERRQCRVIRMYGWMDGRGSGPRRVVFLLPSGLSLLLVMSIFPQLRRGRRCR